MSKTWKIGIVKDTSKPMLGLHALHVGFRGIPNVEVVALVDSNPNLPEGIMECTGAQRHYMAMEEMLKQESPDIVILCSRQPDDHLEQIRLAAKYGGHIYCEKPMVARLSEADEIVKIEQEYGIKICMAHPARYSCGFRTMKKMIEEGAIGTPLLAHGLGKCDHRGGGEDLIVLGTHILDVICFLFGQPESVSAEVLIDGKPVQPGELMRTVEPVGPVAGDTVLASFRFPNGMHGVFESRRGLFRIKTDDAHLMGLTVVGTTGSLSLRFDDVRARQLRYSHLTAAPGDDNALDVVPLVDDRVIAGVEPLDYNLCGRCDIPRSPFFLESNRFAVWDLMRAIEENRQPVSNIYNARQTQEMIQGIYESALSGKTIPLPLVERKHPLE